MRTSTLILLLCGVLACLGLLQQGRKWAHDRRASGQRPALLLPAPPQIPPPPEDPPPVPPGVHPSDDWDRHCTFSGTRQRIPLSTIEQDPLFRTVERASCLLDSETLDLEAARAPCEQGLTSRYHRIRVSAWGCLGSIWARQHTDTARPGPAHDAILFGFTQHQIDEMCLAEAAGEDLLPSQQGPRDGHPAPSPCEMANRPDPGPEPQKKMGSEHGPPALKLEPKIDRQPQEPPPLPPRPDGGAAPRTRPNRGGGPALQHKGPGYAGPDLGADPPGASLVHKLACVFRGEVWPC